MASDFGCIYRGTVMHHRKRPVDHHFRYEVFSLLLDLDRIDEAGRKSRVLSVDRFGLLSIARRDHGPRDGSRLRPWVEKQLKQNGHMTHPARIMLLAMPRVLGYVFNPLSVYFCYDDKAQLSNVVYEVKNTFGSQHVYALAPPDERENGTLSHGCDKAFYVSPFIGMQAHYEFRLRAPDEKLTLAIRETDADGCFFTASHTARRLAWSDQALLRCLLRHSFMTLKVMAGIHFEALRLWLKGAPYFSRAVHPNSD